jgi:cell division protein FtsW (lipid II flippase)
MSARNRELLALVPASLLVTAGFAAIFIERSQELSDVSLTYGAMFLALCVATHVVIRFTLPDADPYIFPLVALLACFGIVVLYRLEGERLVQGTPAISQAGWFVAGLALFSGTIIALRRDFRVLEHYRYTIAAASLLLLLLPRMPVIGQDTRGAFLSVDLGPLSFQPAEFAKIGIVVFLAAYLRENRDVLIISARRVLGITFPPLKHFGPLLAIWLTSLFLLFFIRDIGSSLMFFGGFLAILYVATNRVGFVVVGLFAFAVGAYVIAQGVGHIQDRADIWLDPFAPDVVEGTGFQLAQSLFAQADGGLFGTGFAGSLILTPASETDLIYAVVVNELGLAGACGLLLVYLLLIERGFKTAMIARDSFSTLLAVGLTSVLALQVFVIVGGVTRVIPLTGVTLPFVSYGGSSILANFVLIALLLLVSDRARREAVGR